LVVKLFPVAVIEQPHASVLPGSHHAVIQGGNSKIVDLSGVEVQNDFSFVAFELVLPQGSMGVLDDPVVVLDLDPD
jgi:hypothetical protein